MNKADLVAMVAGKTGTTKKDARQMVDAVLDGIAEALANGDRVALSGFGSFEVRARRARPGRNPRTGKPITITAHKVPVFRPGRPLKNIVN